MDTSPRIGHTEGGHSYVGGDPSVSENWKKVGVVESGHVFQGGDPAKEDNWRPNVNKEDEASLGVVNRAKYSIEPIQSNRKALLEQEYGKENVLEQNGELFLNQDGQFLPLNQDGISLADGADFLGALPEVAGGVVGGVAGAIGGVPTGGVASLPMAIGVGAAGAGVGSAFRQGLSAAIGNPQVATMGERALETGTSAAFGGLASGAGVIAKPYISKAKTGITNFLKGAGKEAADTIGETTTKTIAKTASAIDGELVPNYNPLSSDDIMGAVADQSERGMVQAEQQKLADIAARQGLPDATYAQAAQGKAILAENKVLDMPLISGKIRTHVDKQITFVKKNLEKLTGQAIDSESTAEQVGQATREMAEASVETVKKVAQELYETVEEEGARAMIGKKPLIDRFRNEAAKYNMIGPMGERLAYAADTGLEEETFNRIQKVLFQSIDALDRTISPKINFVDANNLTKTVKATAQSLKMSNPYGHKLLSKFGKDLNGSMEGILNREAPKLGEKFRSANANWAKFKNQEKALGKILGNNRDDGKLAKSIFSSQNSVARISELKEIIGEDRVKSIAKSHVADIFFKLNKSGVARADTAMDELRKIAPQIKAALGKDFYDNALDNLYYLNRTGKPLSISRASLYNVFDNRGEGLKSLTFKALGTANTIASSKGTTLTKAVKDSAINATSKTVKTASGILDKATGKDKLSGIANLLGDNTQRGISNFPAAAVKSISAKEKEIENRKRAISGRKN
jgi:hypothetical protein